ncbi:hypothetical protein GCM10011309_17250 [Litorimonas cladophorae]|uniref:DUF4345 domain-containing protein n=1 Tax=Litorimonas cladophorae TaxID=1220491 RepID=A0A918KN65_9PROT|nr:DUF4345 domain-containing protein [Litorimonas cladophorae]GGX68059.1 hypothetical protein GCM10011309_17250 [Litorimonas cladophorae]
MRNLFKIVLIVLSLIPLYFAVTGVMGGAGVLNGSDTVAASLDNQFRYLSAYYLSLFFLIWYVLGDIDTRGTVLRWLVLAIFLGGLARLYSYLQVGTPTPDMMLGMALELGAPILVLWHRMLERSVGPVVP